MNDLSPLSVCCCALGLDYKVYTHCFKNTPGGIGIMSNKILKLDNRNQFRKFTSAYVLLREFIVLSLGM